MNDLTAVSCPLCLRVQDLESTIRVVIDHGGVVREVEFRLCRACVAAIAEASGNVFEARIKELLGAADAIAAAEEKSESTPDQARPFGDCIHQKLIGQCEICTNLVAPEGEHDGQEEKERPRKRRSNRNV